jgi:regulator of sigma E protease
LGTDLGILALTLATIDWTAWGQNIFYGAIAALGVGAVIFIHELGHFAVAKWCGVKCEKFYIGFGKPLLKFQWGETEYGLGMIPLGGFVKMLGQDDNPSAAAAEMDRARVDQGGAAETPVYDPRSYMAKPVWQRMAIISAGVIMNLIFAFVVASVAYAIGVPDAPCRVGGTVPGGGAWKADIQPGDTIKAINGEPVKRFDDLLGLIALGNHPEGVKIVYVRNGETELREAIIQPNMEDITPRIGLQSANTNQLHKRQAFYPGTPAEKATPALKPNDRIVKIGDTPVVNAWEIDRILAAAPSKPLTITVEREGEKEFTTVLDPAPLKTLGIQMRLGEIIAVQEDSPAAQVDIPATHAAASASGDALSAHGLQPGDLIAAIDGVDTSDIDPLRLPELFRELAGTPVKLNIQRQAGERFDVEITPRAEMPYETARSSAEHGMSIPSLGVVFKVVNNIRLIEPESVAAAKGLKAEDKIEWIEFLPIPESAEKSSSDKKVESQVPVNKRLEFGDDIEKLDWPLFMTSLQALREGQGVRIKTEKSEQPVDLVPSISPDQFNPDRGLALAPERIIIRAESFGEAVSLGAAETWKQATRVYSFIRQLVVGNVSVKGAGGPFTIAQGAFYLAAEGPSEFLMFLVMISANLAVINFLPIPVLDGGHFMFLTLEWLRGKPASEKVFIGATYAGLAFLLLVMGFVMFLDVSRMAGWL